MTTLRPDYQTGAARIDGATGAALYVAGLVSGCTRTALGTYELALLPGANANEHTMQASAITNGATATGINLELVSNTVVRVRTTVAGAQADLSFYFVINRVRTSS